MRGCLCTRRAGSLSRTKLASVYEKISFYLQGQNCCFGCCLNTFNIIITFIVTLIYIAHKSMNLHFQMRITKNKNINTSCTEPPRGGAGGAICPGPQISRGPQLEKYPKIEQGPIKIGASTKH